MIEVERIGSAGRTNAGRAETAERGGVLDELEAAADGRTDRGTLHARKRKEQIEADHEEEARNRHNRGARCRKIEALAERC